MSEREVTRDERAEGQVTEQWIAVFADEENRRVVTVLREIKRMDLDPLSRRVEELEAGLREILRCSEDDAMSPAEFEEAVMTEARALLKDGER